MAFIRKTERKIINHKADRCLHAQMSLLFTVLYKAISLAPPTHTATSEHSLIVSFYVEQRQF
jgi:hypothetical protein